VRVRRAHPDAEAEQGVVADEDRLTFGCDGMQRAVDVVVRPDAERGVAPYVDDELRGVAGFANADKRIAAREVDEAPIEAGALFAPKDVVLAFEGDFDVNSIGVNAVDAVGSLREGGFCLEIDLRVGSPGG
jgi:hypothetical protein